jgi:hypothetical protein
MSRFGDFYQNRITGERVVVLRGDEDTAPGESGFGHLTRTSRACSWRCTAPTSSASASTRCSRRSSGWPTPDAMALAGIAGAAAGPAGS